MNALAAWTFALIVFGAQMSGWYLGRLMRARLPQEHLTSSTRDAVILAVGVVATLSALVLSLMISSAKTSYDADRLSVVEVGASILMMDRALAHYGTESKAARDALRELTALAAAEVGEEPPSGTQVTSGPPLPHLTKLQNLILALSPANDSQRWAKTRALSLTTDLERSRVLLAERSDGSIPLLFLIVLMIWLATLYLSWAIFAPLNGTVSASACGGALAFAMAIFLILELDRPFHGVVRVSNESQLAPLQLLVR
jgi:hypothetical protein